MVEDDQGPPRTQPDLWNRATDRSAEGGDGASAGGLQVDRYDPHEMLGTGGMAEVWLARDTSLQRDVAVKLMKAQFLDDPDLVERFRREGVAAASINHPNVVPIYDVGTGGGVGYLVMEHVPGGTLTELIKSSGPIGPKAWIRLAREVLGALEAVHEAGILHRDIKPSNILFNTRGAAKVADFGIAHLDDARGLTGSMVVGTPTYLSPEVLQGELATAASDLFALGRTLVFAATGNAKNPGLTESYPPDLHNWLARLLAFDSKARFPSAGAALEELEAISRGEPTPTPVITQAMRAMPIGPHETGSDVPTLAGARAQTSSGLPWAVAGLAIGALVTVLVLVLPSLRGGDEPSGEGESLTSASIAAAPGAAGPAPVSQEASSKPAEDGREPETGTASEPTSAASSPDTTAATPSADAIIADKQSKAQPKPAAAKKKTQAEVFVPAPVLTPPPPAATSALTLSHEKVPRALVGSSFRLTAKTGSEASSVLVMLKVGPRNWQSKAMTSSDGLNWSFSIKVPGNWMSGTSYYIVATDAAGNSANSGSASGPYKLKIR